MILFLITAGCSPANNLGSGNSQEALSKPQNDQNNNNIEVSDNLGSDNSQVALSTPQNNQNNNNVEISDNLLDSMIEDTQNQHFLNNQNRNNLIDYYVNNETQGISNFHITSLTPSIIETETTQKDTIIPLQNNLQSAQPEIAQNNKIPQNLNDATILSNSFLDNMFSNIPISRQGTFLNNQNNIEEIHVAQQKAQVNSDKNIILQQQIEITQKNTNEISKISDESTQSNDSVNVNPVSPKSFQVEAELKLDSFQEKTEKSEQAGLSKNSAKIKQSIISKQEEVKKAKQEEDEKKLKGKVKIISDSSDSDFEDDNNSKADNSKIITGAQIDSSIPYLLDANVTASVLEVAFINPIALNKDLDKTEIIQIINDLDNFDNLPPKIIEKSKAILEEMLENIIKVEPKRIEAIKQFINCFREMTKENELEELTESFSQSVFSHTATEIPKSFSPENTNVNFSYANQQQQFIFENNQVPEIYSVSYYTKTTNYTEENELFLTKRHPSSGHFKHIDDNEKRPFATSHYKASKTFIAPDESIYIVYFVKVKEHLKDDNNKTTSNDINVIKIKHYDVRKNSWNETTDFKYVPLVGITDDMVRNDNIMNHISLSIGEDSKPKYLTSLSRMDNSNIKVVLYQYSNDNQWKPIDDGKKKPITNTSWVNSIDGTPYILNLENDIRSSENRLFVGNISNSSNNIAKNAKLAYIQVNSVPLNIIGVSFPIKDKDGKLTLTIASLAKNANCKKVNFTVFTKEESGDKWEHTSNTSVEFLLNTSFNLKDDSISLESLKASDGKIYTVVIISNKHVYLIDSEKKSKKIDVTAGLSFEQVEAFQIKNYKLLEEENVGLVLYYRNEKNVLKNIIVSQNS